MSCREHGNRREPSSGFSYPLSYETPEEQQQAQRESNAANQRNIARNAAEMAALAAEMVALQARRIRGDSEVEYEDEEVSAPPEDPNDTDYVPPGGQRGPRSGPRRPPSSRAPPGMDVESGVVGPSLDAPVTTRRKGKGRAVPVEEEDVPERSGGESDGGVEDEDGDGQVEAGAETAESEDPDAADGGNGGVEGGDEDEEDDDSDEEGDILPVASTGWVLGQPRSQPLRYYVIVDAAGTLEVKTIKFDVDFNDNASVNAANKRRRNEKDRAWKRTGLPKVLKRPPTIGREYDQERNDVIMALHESYANHNNGARIPALLLTSRYNNIFRGENRTELSITSHIQRTQQLKNHRNSFT